MRYVFQYTLNKVLADVVAPKAVSESDVGLLGCALCQLSRGRCVLLRCGGNITVWLLPPPWYQCILQMVEGSVAAQLPPSRFERSASWPAGGSRQRSVGKGHGCLVILEWPPLGGVSR